MPDHATTQTVNEATKAAGWAAITAAALRVAYKVADLWRFRASVENRLFVRLEASLQQRIADLEDRIRTLEDEKTALQLQNKGQGDRIAALEKELAADKELRHKLRNELQVVTSERDLARAEAERLRKQ